MGRSWLRVGILPESSPFESSQFGGSLRLDLRGNTPTCLHLSYQELHDVHVFGLLLPELRAFYVMDLSCFDVGQLHRLHAAGSFFMTRAKCNLSAQRCYLHPRNRSAGLLRDQTIVLADIEIQGSRTIKMEIPA